MKSRLILITLLCWLSNSQAQGVFLNTSDSYLFEFTSLSYQREAREYESSLYYVNLASSSFLGNKSLLIELFPNTLSDTPLSFTFSSPTDPPGNDSTEIYHATILWPSDLVWPDLQGIVKITMLAGNAELTGFGIQQVVNGAVYSQFFRIAVDTDHDGVPDYRDACADTPIASIVDAHGCSIQQLCQCDGPWKNHGEYLNKLRTVAANFLSQKLITETESRGIMANAAKSNCGKR
jgi:hypothetical protein